MRDGWVETILGEVADVIDPHPSHRAPAVDENGIPFIGIGDLRKTGDIDFAKARRVSRDILEEHKSRYDRSEFLIGLGRVASIGMVVRLPDENIEYVVSPTLAVIKAREVIGQFLFYLLEGPHSQEQFQRFKKGSTRESVGMQILRKIKVQVPPLPEQKRIVDLISSIDSYLGSLRSALAKSISARKSALESQLDSFNKTSPIFRLEELCATGKSAIVDGPFGANLKREDYLEEGVPVLKIQNIKQDDVVIKKMDFVSENKYQELRRHSFQKGDIVMTKLGDPLGLSAIVREIDKGLIVADLVRIRPDKIDVEFLCMQLNSAKIQNYINRMQKGSTRPRVNLGMIREMPIAVPSERDINDFVNIFGAWSQQNRILEETIHSTEQLRSSVLSDLLSGKHEIPANYDNVIGAA